MKRSKYYVAHISKIVKTKLKKQSAIKIAPIFCFTIHNYSMYLLTLRTLILHQSIWFVRILRKTENVQRILICMCLYTLREKLLTNNVFYGSGFCPHLDSVKKSDPDQKHCSNRNKGPVVLRTICKGNTIPGMYKISTPHWLRRLRCLSHNLRVAGSSPTRQRLWRPLYW